MKVYAIMVCQDPTDPDPSYRLATICSSKEKANLLRGSIFGLASPYIQEVEIDALDAMNGKKYYCVTLKENGISEVIEERHNIYIETPIYRGSNSVSICVWAKDEMEALRIAEKMQKEN